MFWIIFGKKHKNTPNKKKITGLSRKFMYPELIMVFWSLIMFSFIINISDVYPALVPVENGPNN